MSKQRAKGTGWEVELLPLLRQVFGDQVERAPLKGINDFGDFLGCDGLLIEAKKVNSPRFLEWARKAKAKAGPHGWRIVWSGDRRKGDGPYVLMSMNDWLELEAKAGELDTKGRAT